MEALSNASWQRTTVGREEEPKRGRYHAPWGPVDGDRCAAQVEGLYAADDGLPVGSLASAKGTITQEAISPSGAVTGVAMGNEDASVLERVDTPEPRLVRAEAGQADLCAMKEGREHAAAADADPSATALLQALPQQARKRSHVQLGVLPLRAARAWYRDT